MAKKKDPPAKTINHDMKITVTKDGPYLISGSIPMKEMEMAINDAGDPQGWLEKKQYPLQERCALCRCGGSSKTPFCDGSHKTNGFDGTEEASLDLDDDAGETIDGPGLKLIDIEELCASARFCHRAGGTWELTERSGDPEAKRIAIEEAGDCPGSRLTVYDKRSGKAIEPKFERSIGLVFDPQAKVNGPIWVRGGILIESADGKVYQIRNRITLCRCGKSYNKPFCDSGHLY